MQDRKGARSLKEVPTDVLDALAAGEIESVNLMEWLAADMSALALRVASQMKDHRVRSGLEGAARQIVDVKITARLSTLGNALATSGLAEEDEDFHTLANHRSDLVRQWACYFVNSGAHAVRMRGTYRRNVVTNVENRISATIRFADDRNMTVRETAWMAVRPHVASDLAAALPILTELASSESPRVRRFAVEVTRPRSVWGSHISELKANPESARVLLERVRTDESRYVQLAVGNWLNDASKSRPEWVMNLCSKWVKKPNQNAQRIVSRGMRTLARVDSSAATPQRRGLGT